MLVFSNRSSRASALGGVAGTPSPVKESPISEIEQEQSMTLPCLPAEGGEG